MSVCVCVTRTFLIKNEIFQFAFPVLQPFASISRRQRICMSFVHIQFTVDDGQAVRSLWPEYRHSGTKLPKKFIKLRWISIGNYYFHRLFTLLFGRFPPYSCEHLVSADWASLYFWEIISKSFSGKNVCVFCFRNSRAVWDDKRQHSHIHIIRLFAVFPVSSSQTEKWSIPKWTTKQSIDPIKICKRIEAEVFEEFLQVKTLNHKLTTQMKYDC